MKVRSKDLSKDARISTLDALYTAAGTVRGRTAMKTFLRDLLTESERIMMGRRILIARELLSGRTFDEIAVEMRVSNTTIRKVDRWLNDQFPGYEDAVRAMEKEFKSRTVKQRDTKKGRNFDPYLYATSPLYRLKKKYPIHFLLFPTPKRKD